MGLYRQYATPCLHDKMLMTGLGSQAPCSWTLEESLWEGSEKEELL